MDGVETQAQHPRGVPMTTKCDAKTDDICEDAAQAVKAGSQTIGLTWMPWMRLTDGLIKIALVYRYGRKQAEYTICKACPFCGADVSLEAQDWRERA